LFELVPRNDQKLTRDAARDVEDTAILLELDTLTIIVESMVLELKEVSPFLATAFAILAPGVFLVVYN
jgi:hypothetical protein